MHAIFLYGYVTASVGVAISLLYLGLFSYSQQRNLRHILESTAFLQLYESVQTYEQKYANWHRTKLVTRRLLNKINQLNPRIHLPVSAQIPRWKLIYTASGEVRAIPLAP